MAAPVVGEAYEAVPPSSGNVFIPPPFTIVEDQFVCPMEELLFVHLDGDDHAMELAECETRCKSQASCMFYWHGTQHNAGACRLYSGCSVLVREFGMEGKLVAPATDSAASAATCWTWFRGDRPSRRP